MPFTCPRINKPNWRRTLEGVEWSSESWSEPTSFCWRCTSEAKADKRGLLWSVKKDRSLHSLLPSGQFGSAQRDPKCARDHSGSAPYRCGTTSQQRGSYRSMQRSGRGQPAGWDGLGSVFGSKPGRNRSREAAFDNSPPDSRQQWAGKASVTTDTGSNAGLSGSLGTTAFATQVWPTLIL